jgi:hypothetical protein
MNSQMSSLQWYLFEWRYCREPPIWLRTHTLAVAITNHFLIRRPTPFQSVFDSNSFISLSTILISFDISSSHFTFHIITIHLMFSFTIFLIVLKTYTHIIRTKT